MGAGPVCQMALAWTAISSGDVILVIVLAVIPIAALSFALGARGALGQIGGGPLSMDRSEPPRRGEGGSGPAPAEPDEAPPEVREAEVRQMLEAKAYLQRERGEDPVDVDRELDRLTRGRGSEPAADSELVAEVRALAVARNERRIRQGREPLDVEAEVRRKLRELGELS